MKVINVSHLPGWHISHLARRYAGMAAESHHREVSSEDRARMAEIAAALRAHPKHPRSKP